MIEKKLEDLNLLEKIQCVTTDGASNMKTMYQELQNNQFDWIWCVPHRFHLVVNNALGLWPKKKKKKKKEGKQKADVSNKKKKDITKKNKNSATTVNNDTKNGRGSQTSTADSDTTDNDFNEDICVVESTKTVDSDDAIDEHEDEELFWDDATEGNKDFQLKYNASELTTDFLFLIIFGFRSIG